MYPLSDKKRATLRNELSEVRVLIIDEIPIVSNILFFQVHRRLNEIFGCGGNVRFSGLPVLVCGDFYQLPPVGGLPMYANASSMKGYLNIDLWRNFKFAELAEVMR